MEDIVSYAEGSYERYIESGTYIRGRLYYLTDNDGKTYIYLNGKDYGGKLNSSDIKMPETIVVTKDTGNYAVGDPIYANTPVVDVLTTMLSKDIVPVVNAVPAMSIGGTSSWTNNNGNREIGTTLEIVFTATLSRGSYKLPLDTGDVIQDAAVEPVAGSWEIALQGASESPIWYTNSSSSTNKVYYTLRPNDNIYLSGHVDGKAGATPLTYLGKPYPSIQFPAARYTATSSHAYAYRAYFAGWYNSDDVVDVSIPLTDTTNPKVLTAARIRQDGGRGSYFYTNNSRKNTLNTFGTSANPAANLQQMMFAFPKGKCTAVAVTGTSPAVTYNMTKHASTIMIPAASSGYEAEYEVFYYKADTSIPVSQVFTIAYTWA